jgi:hypothetical protein
MNFSVYWQHADAVSKTLYFIFWQCRLQRGRSLFYVSWEHAN